jgi:hypothetical protein
MPWIIDYETVTEQMRGQQLKCNYYNSGAFGFADPAGVRHLGWIGPEDPSIRLAVIRRNNIARRSRSEAA